MGWSARRARVGYNRAVLTRRDFIDGLLSWLITRDGGAVHVLRLASAPFPVRGKPYKDNSVHVYVPPGFAPLANGRVPLVAHFHGHLATAASNLADKALTEQLVSSGRRALLVVPQLADNARDSHAGKLEHKGGFAAMSRELLAHPSLALPTGAKPGPIALSAHSGGFQAAARVIQRGQLPISQVLLFDALYGFSRIFAEWLAADPHRRLTSWSTGQRTVEKWTHTLEALLKKHRVSAEQYRFITSTVPHAQVPVTGHPLAHALKSGPLPAL